MRYVFLSMNQCYVEVFNSVVQMTSVISRMYRLLLQPNSTNAVELVTIWGREEELGSLKRLPF